MTSKKSFMGDMIENNKRRIWVWIISGLLWFFYYPVGMIIQLTSVKNRYAASAESGMMKQSLEELLAVSASGWMTANSLQAVAISLLAVLCAIQGFSYLYSKKKVDLYHSVPVKKTRRFAVIYLNGVLIYLLPLLVNQLLAMAAAGINGAMNMEVASGALLALVMNTVLFLATYSLIMIAVMLTGNVIITIFASAVFLFYEIVVRELILIFEQDFFEYFSYSGREVTPLLSPAGNYYKALEGMLEGSCLPSILHNLLLTVIFGLLAFFCYKKRPSEAAGKTMAFPRTKGIVKILIATVGALFGGIIAYDSTNGNMTAGNVALILFVMAAIVIVISGMMEVIYELDIKAAFHKKYQILISGLCAVAFFCVFQFDLLGYDKWVPNPEELDSAVVRIYNIPYENNIYDENLNQVYNYKNYYSDKSGIKDVEAICELSKDKVSNDQPGAQGSEVEYRLKNGKTVWRTFNLNGEKEDLMNRIVGTEEFRQAVYLWYDDTFYQNFSKLDSPEILFDNGMTVQNLMPEDMTEIRNLLKKDYAALDYSGMKHEFICGYINFSAWKEDGSNIMFQCNIYPSFQNIQGYLKEKGIYGSNSLDPEKIESITVTNYHQELDQQEAIGYRNYPMAVSRTASGYEHEITKTFTDRKQIEELVGAMYSQSFDKSVHDDISSDYSVTVQLKSSEAANNAGYYRGSDLFYLIEGRVPEFVDRETAYE